MATMDVTAPPAAAPPRWRERLIPKTVLGMATLILALAVGAAASGVAFYSYYEFKRDTTERSVAKFVTGFDDRFNTALKTIDAQTTNSKAEIAKELEPLKQTQATGDTMEALISKVKGSIFFISTLDEAGQASVGTAFAVASDNDQTLLLTSFATIRSSTRQPGPPGGIRIRQGDQDFKGSLWTWDEGKDLALIVLAKGGVPRIEAAPSNPPLKAGERIFAISALGAAGGAATQGYVADVSAAGIQHDAAIGQAFQGGPLLNSEGKVVAVASRIYAPLNFQSDGVWFAPSIKMACEKVLKCPSGDISGAGDKTNPAPPTTQAPATTTTVKR